MDAVASDGAGRRILIVEDEMLVAILVEEAVAELGFVPVGPANSVAQAVALAGTEELAGAILDVNVRGQSVYPAADVLQSRGIPFVFMTGYRRDELPPPHSSAPALEKPFDNSMLTAAIRAFARTDA